MFHRLRIRNLLMIVFPEKILLSLLISTAALIELLVISTSFYIPSGAKTAKDAQCMSGVGKNSGVGSDAFGF